MKLLANDPFLLDQSMVTYSKLSVLFFLFPKLEKVDRSSCIFVGVAK